MGQGYKMLGFAVIAVLYVVIGVMAARGTICIFRKIFSPKAEQILYAMFLIMIAALYLAFAAYFGASTAWRVETIAVGVFVAIGLVGMRVPLALIVGFPLHGLWDFLHELQAHGLILAAAKDAAAGQAGAPVPTHAIFDAGQLTAIPLAYGFFCAAFDFYMAGYFYGRRTEWIGAWKAA